MPNGETKMKSIVNGSPVFLLRITPSKMCQPASSNNSSARLIVVAVDAVAVVRRLLERLREDAIGNLAAPRSKSASSRALGKPLWAMAEFWKKLTP